MEIDINSIHWDITFYKAVASIFALIIVSVVHRLARRAILKVEQRHGFRRHRVAFIHKFTQILAVMLSVFVLIAIWGFNVENVWIFISSLLGLIAIGFFAVWSILSNIIAGVLVFFTNPFRIGERIFIIDGEIDGTVEDITLMFTELSQPDGAKARIPNNFFFQKAVRILPKDYQHPVKLE